MQPTYSIPSLLLFGPQTDFPPSFDSTLHHLHQEILTNPLLSPLRDAITSLPKFWPTLLDFDPTLSHIPGAESLTKLSKWVQNGGEFPSSDVKANLFALPCTVIFHVCQYTLYLSSLDNTKDPPHRSILENVKAGGGGGIQGFCVGFLSALVVATSQTEAEIGVVAATALKLAVCVGAYVDRDLEAGRYSTVAIRWRKNSAQDKAELEKVIESYPGAYISSVNDGECVTVTVREKDMETLVAEMKDKGLKTSHVGVSGRFHYEGNADVVGKLMRFVEGKEELQFPGVERLVAKVRSTSTVDGGVITRGSLTRIAVENMLLRQANWYTTVRESVLELPKGNKRVAVGGFGNHVPSSLVRSLSLDILGLNGLERKKEVPGYPSHSIAIVGMAGRFPGADSVDELWDLLAQGKVTVQRAPVDRLGLPQTGDHEHTNWWGNFLRDPDAFDHRFFKKSSREAVNWDPQQRILLEVVYQALESSGYFGAAASLAVEPDDYGCYIGAVLSDYSFNASCHPATAYSTLGTARSFVSGTVSHYFGWTGPSLTIDTACSSSLVAINTACRAIWSGECSRAIAGGTNVISSPFDYRNLQGAGFLSPTGQCKPFDADADGYCRGEAVAVVVLKKLEDAIKENDNILGVIVGSAASQNHNHSHITVPHSGSQVQLYRKVTEMGGVKPESVSYVEAHGTGTGVGDPVEVRSIIDAFGGAHRHEVLHFGSIKGNIGHTESTAGVAGLIKVLLMMREGQIVTQASHNRVNPKLPDFVGEKMEIPRSIISWNMPFRLACVNSYGAAGSNSAVMVFEKPPVPAGTSSPVISHFPLFISAGSANSLSMYSKKLLEWLKDSTTTTADLTFNLADRANHSLSHILSTTVTSLQDLKSKLEAAASGSGTTTNSAPQNPKPVILVFGGQESDCIGLSEDIYNSSNIFRHHLDSVNDLVVAQGLDSLYSSIFSQEPIQNLVALHAALFAVQYASEKAWIDSGLNSNVSAVVGHSFGQLTAFAISGALSLSDALKLVTGRAALMQTHWGDEAGSMLFMQADRQTVHEALHSLKAQNDDELYAEIACYNGPKSHVVVGSSKAINLLEGLVSVRTKKLNVTNGFHSKYTEGLLPHLTDLAKSLNWKRPTIYLETTDEFDNRPEPDYTIVAEHSRCPVFFQQAIERLSKRFPSATWIEAGRGSSVIQLVKGCIPAHSNHLFLSPQLTTSNSPASLSDTTVNLWKNGYSVQFWPFHRTKKAAYNYLNLPPYQFEKTRHWLPFIGRTGKTDVTPAPVQENTHQLLTFISSDKTTALFKISPQSPHFQSLLSSHLVTGQPFAPVSLYFELVSSATLTLTNDPNSKAYTPSLTNLHFLSPITLDPSQQITLTLTQSPSTSNSPDSPSWSFLITLNSTKQSTGQITLKPRSSSDTTLEFSRYEKLTGHKRIQSILSDPNADKMQGPHIYRAFNSVVQYGPLFRGIKEIACVGSEAAGRVVIPAIPAMSATPATPGYKTGLLDSFMQFAGFLVNYFGNEESDEVKVCTEVERIELGAGFDSDVGEWIAYGNRTEGGEKEGEVVEADVYVFDGRNGKMVFGGFGFKFSRGRKMSIENVKVEKTKKVEGSKKAKTVGVGSKRGELFKVLADVTDVAVEEIKAEMTLEDLGVDSLMATEVLNDIRSVLGVSIDMTTFLFFPDLKALAACVDEKLGVVGGTEEEEEEEDTTPTSPDSSIAGMGSLTPPSPCPDLTSAIESFQQIRFNYDQLAKGSGALDFWSDAYPLQARLVLAHIVEAFAQLGCDLMTLNPGDPLPELHGVLPRHTRLIQQFFRALKDGKLITGQPGDFKRTATPLDKTPASTIYDEILSLHPQHANVNKMVQIVGSKLAPCLKGDLDGLQVVFGSRETKKTLEDIYEFWPLARTPTLVLGDFLVKAFTTSGIDSGAFRILEIGGGTGGTTRYLIDHLRSHGIKYEYVFTDISVSLVAAAKKHFKAKGIDQGMRFEVLDVEKVPEEYNSAFHVIISSNCIHATRDLSLSLKNIKGMLRDDGVLTLIEITQNQFWLDIVFGLLEGWWLFSDGRSHALVSETHWEKEMLAAGFTEVLWSDGQSQESKTVRVIAAFSSGKATPIQPKKTPVTTIKATLETVVYKKLGDLEIHADIYYPLSPLETKKLPIALMIHGGSHVIFSRKDIRPPQTRLLLEQGYLPVSLDHRLCPEVSLSQGPMVDVCDALNWARTVLPTLKPNYQIDGDLVVVVGWSSGGHLAMSLGWTAPQRGLRPPEAILAFYCPTDYLDPWWQSPIQPIGAPDTGIKYDILEAIQDEPITNYGIVGAWEPLSDPRMLTDPRCRIVAHINWKAQTLPVIIGGLPSRSKAVEKGKDWNKLAQPSEEEIKKVSPREQIEKGGYKTPTFLVHGTADDLIPWEQSQGTYEVLKRKGVESELVLVEGAPHICDVSSDGNSEGWKAVLKGYEFLKRTEDFNFFTAHLITSPNSACTNISTAYTLNPLQLTTKCIDTENTANPQSQDAATNFATMKPTGMLQERLCLSGAECMSVILPLSVPPKD
ncbi:hypothetical protein QBC38DRAFT_522639 [Podospora fimiseda]|uniref:Polyketide synthase n=1 Tax=Podospora fimiseda TaxID=252190 RepID=A0AAN7BEU5_9PEZI|nr:hypothetical protein QBC38DRAFT_522639 [Podospora fimiseda]